MGGRSNSNSKATTVGTTTQNVSTPGTAFGTSFLNTQGPKLQTELSNIQPFSGNRTQAPTDLGAGNYVAQPRPAPISTTQRTTADSPTLAGLSFVAPNAQEGIDAGLAAATRNQSANRPLIDQARAQWGNVLQGGGNPHLQQLIDAMQADYARSGDRANQQQAQAFGFQGSGGGSGQARASTWLNQAMQQDLNRQTSGLRYDDYLNSQRMLLAAPGALGELTNLEAMPAEQFARYGGMRQGNLAAQAANTQSNQNIANTNAWNAGRLADTNAAARTQDNLFQWTAQNQAEQARVADLLARAGVQQQIGQTGLDNAYAQYASGQDAVSRRIAASQALMDLARSVPGSSIVGTENTTTTGKQREATTDWGPIAQIGAAAIASMFSDRRLKADIVPLGRKIGGIPVYQYRYKTDLPGTVRFGVMADEVEKVAPDAVSIGHDGFKMVDYSKLEA